MKSQINTLRKLQELVLTRDEHHQTGDGSQLDNLSDKIAELQSQLNPQVRGVYDRLYKKGHIVMAAMSNGCCAACGMCVLPACAAVADPAGERGQRREAAEGRPAPRGG